jgi:thymidylate synthase (FAD)
MSSLTNRPPISAAAEEIIGGYFPVLDHGFVGLLDVMGSDEAIEQAARLSYQAGTRKTSQTRGLLRYLKRHAHTSPFEMVELKFHVSMPMFIARQWIRHRTASVNEVSGRYSLLPMLFYTPEAEDFGVQSANNKQARGDAADLAVYRESVSRWNYRRELAVEHYAGMIGADVAREIARIDLPLSTYTTWVWKIDLHNLFHFLRLRVHEHAQREIAAYGKIIAGMVARIAPLAYEAWVDYDVAGVKLSYGEIELIRTLVLNAPTRDFVGCNFARGTGYNGDSAMATFGLDAREWIELQQKLKPVGRPDFQLDLSQMRSGAVFEEKMLAAVPQIDKK